MTVLGRKEQSKKLLSAERPKAFLNLDYEMDENLKKRNEKKQKETGKHFRGLNCQHLCWFG